jgi:hypothetical protein
LVARQVTRGIYSDDEPAPGDFDQAIKTHTQNPFDSPVDMARIDAGQHPGIVSRPWEAGMTSRAIFVMF